MAKYTIVMSCGHNEVHEIFGTNVHNERDHKAEWLASRLCKECYLKEQTKDCNEVEMKYSEYKNNYADYKTKSGSYNKKAKTIIVYLSE